MAIYKLGSGSGEESLEANLSSLRIAHCIQNALDAIWKNLPPPERTAAAIGREALDVLSRVEETWWNKLDDRSPEKLTESFQSVFVMSRGVDSAPGGAKQMFQWFSEYNLAQALLFAWALQPEGRRDLGRTTSITRTIIERETRNAAEDIALFK